MSNQNKPRFSLPGTIPPPPTSALAADMPPLAAEVIEKFPLPWCVGPYGDIWVAADVERVTDPQEMNLPGVVEGWRPTGAKARMVMENPADQGIAALLVYAANRLR